MKTVELKTKKREEVGKRTAKQVRAAGEVPAIVYGAGKETIAVQMNLKEFESIIHTEAGENAVITLKIEGGKKAREETVLIKDIQHDPVSDRIQHVDFNIISLTEKITAEVPVHEKGESAGVKEGGVLDHVHRTVTVECLPTLIPDKIVVMIDKLNINDAIHTKELPLPEGVRCLLDPDEVIMKVLPPQKEEVPAEEAEEGAAEPEVLTEKKKEEAPEAAGEGKPEPKAKPAGKEEEKK